MIILILIFGLILRLVNLNQSLWLDEAVQAITSKGSFSAIFSELQGDFHTPLYHVLMWAWVHLLGFSEIVLRLPSVFFGVATIYVVYLIAKNIFSKKHLFAELSALLMAVAPFHIYYSQEARPYALVTFLTSLSMYFFLKEKWVKYLVSTVLAFYASYFVLFIILTQGLIILVRKKYFQYLYILISLLFFIPWLPMFLTQIKVGQQATMVLPEWGRLVNASFIKALPLTFIKFTIGRITIFNKIFYVVITGLLFLAYGGLITKALLVREKFKVDNSKLIIFLWLIIPVILAWLISLAVPNYQPFRLLLVLPAFYLILAIGIISFKSRILSFLAFLFIFWVSVFSFLTYYFNPYFQREDWRGVVRFIESQDKSTVALLPSATSDWPWRYYSSGKVEIVGVSSGAREINQKDFNNLTIKQSNDLTIYYIRYLQPIFDPQEKTISWLQSLGYVKIREVSFNQIPVWEYKLSR